MMLASALAFAPSLHVCPQRHAAVVSSPSMMAKGFGKPSPSVQKAAEKKAAKAVKPKSEASAARSKANDDFDKLKASGSPEYMVLIRECPEGAEKSKWYPVGGIAVPRSSSEDVALSMAIFQNEDELLKGAFRTYPFLKQSKEKFEYGFRLKEFEDDPVKIADKEATEPSTNPVMQWFQQLDSPLNDGSGWGNPLNRN